MSFSDDEKQNKLGDELYKEVFENLDKYDDEFSINLRAILSKSLRSIAFTRDAHVRYLTSISKDLIDKKEYWNQFLQMATLSKGGLPLQILSFLGFGSLGDATKILNRFLISTPLTANVTHTATANVTQVNATLSKIAGLTSNATQASTNMTHVLNNTVSNTLDKISDAVGNTTRIISDLAPSLAKPSVTTSTSLSTDFFTNFIIYGVLGLVIVMIALRVFSHLYLERQRKKLEDEQESYYVHTFKKDMTDSLFYFFQDLKSLFEHHYQGYQEEILTKTDSQIREYIFTKILPPDKLKWAIGYEDGK